MKMRYSHFILKDLFICVIFFFYLHLTVFTHIIILNYFIGSCLSRSLQTYSKTGLEGASKLKYYFPQRNGICLEANVFDTFIKVKLLVILVCLPLEVIIQHCASLLGHDEHNDTTVEKVDFARESALNQQPSTSGDREVPHWFWLINFHLFCFVVDAFSFLVDIACNRHAHILPGVYILLQSEPPPPLAWKNSPLKFST